MTERKEAILKAMDAVEKGASISAAARHYGIPRSTLDDKIRGRYSVECSKGPATVLSKEEENHLKKWIIFMADSGFPVTKAQLLDSVSLLVKKMKRDNPFQNGRPGRHWFEAFIKRHPEVGQRVAQNLTQTRALVQESNLRGWFKEVEDYFLVAQLEEAAQDPRRIFNCDESAFFLSPTDNRVLAKRGAKNVYNIIPSSEKECVTVLVTANAAGELAPPMVLFKLKSIPHKISKTAPNDWGLGFTPKGWMTGESFYEYMANVFFPWIEKTDIQLPIIFFLDGHCSHTTLPLSNFCREKNIQLVALYPNATHLIQPMDVAVFRPLKRIWKKAVYDWRNDNQFVKLKKENFCPLLHKSLKQLDSNSIKNGFRKCGLSPFDANNVDYSKCVTSYPKKSAQSENVNHLQSDTVSHFKYFESQISPENLEAFYGNKSPTWKGEKSLEGLFNVWRHMNSQHNLPSDRFNNDSTSSTHLSTQETSNINESPSFGDIGNITGLTDILDSNILNSIDLSDLITENKSHKVNVEKIEVYENLNGTLTKIMDMEIPINNEHSLAELVEGEKTGSEKTQKGLNFSGQVKILDMEIPTNEPSLAELVEGEKTGSEETQKGLNFPGQVVTTKGSNPIYLTFNKKNATNTGMTSAAYLPSVETTSNFVETVTMPKPSLCSYKDSTVALVKTPTDILSTMTQTSFSSVETGHIIPPGKTSPIFSKKIKATTPLLPGNKTPDKIKTSENKKTPPHTPIIKALPEDENRVQPKTKYYGHLVVPTPFKDALFWPDTPSSSTKSKVKLPSVITSDRWQIFAQKKIEAKTKKEKNKVIAKDKKSKKTVLGGGNKKSKKLIDTGTMDITNEDWFCRLCQRSTKLDMIQCVTCKVWYHTVCAEVLPNEITFRCMYCNVSFDE